MFFVKEPAFWGIPPSGGKMNLENSTLVGSSVYEMYHEITVRSDPPKWWLLSPYVSLVPLVPQLVVSCCVVSRNFRPAFRRSSQVDEDTAVPRDKQLRLRECECPQALMVPWILAPNLGRWTWNIWNGRKKSTGNSDKTNQRERKKMACWNGCSMFVLLFLYHVISYLKNNASWFRVFHMDPVVVTSGCVRLRVLFWGVTHWDEFIDFSANQNCD